MNMILTRSRFLSTGIFGTLESFDESICLYTLEHAYPDPAHLPDDNAYIPKLPPGTYTCKLGMHTLEHHPKPFKAYEVTNVPGHSGILIHVGNTNSDSSGCILVGLDRQDAAIRFSESAFMMFMTYQQGAEEFILTVT